jgi:hypothetical protein
LGGTHFGADPGCSVGEFAGDETLACFGDEGGDEDDAEDSAGFGVVVVVVVCEGVRSVSWGLNLGGFVSARIFWMGFFSGHTFGFSAPSHWQVGQGITAGDAAVTMTHEQDVPPRTQLVGDDAAEESDVGVETVVWRVGARAGLLGDEDAVEVGLFVDGVDEGLVMPGGVEGAVSHDDAGGRIPSTADRQGR